MFSIFNGTNCKFSLIVFWFFKRTIVLRRKKKEKLKRPKIKDGGITKRKYD
jgi:hypothetical protein